MVDPMSPSPHRRAFIEDFYAIPEAERFHELIGGEIILKASPSGEHGNAQAGVIGAVHSPFQRAPGRGGPGGWWIAAEVEVLLEGTEVVRPDVLGWRRERCPERPTGMPVKQCPDWVCEVLSPTNAKNDTVKKLQLYHRCAISHYWIIDPRDATLIVMRWTSDRYVTLMTAQRGETVRPEPFQQIELAVGTLFGDDPPEP
jgi:Uma2 family endonuclease